MSLALSNRRSSSSMPVRPVNQDCVLLRVILGGFSGRCFVTLVMFSSGCHLLRCWGPGTWSAMTPGLPWGLLTALMSYALLEVCICLVCRVSFFACRAMEVLQMLFGWVLMGR